MADDDSDFGPVYQSGDEALKHPPRPAGKDPGETAPPVSEAEEGVPEGDQQAVAAHQAELKVQHDLETQEKARRSVMRLQNVTHPMWDKYRQIVMEDQQMARNMPEQEPPPPMPQEQKNNYIGAVATMLAIAVPIALAFGRKGNGYAKGAMMAGLGAAMKNFAEGRERAGENAMKEWHEQVSAIHQSNEDRMKIYQDILKNKKLELDDQFKLIHSVAQEFWDPYMADAARKRHMPGVTKQMENQQKVDKAFVKGTGNIAKKVGHAKDWPDYVEYMKSKYHVDPNVDPVGADKKESYVDWQEHDTGAQRRKRYDKQHPATAEDVNAPPDEDEKAKARALLLD